MSAPGTFRVEVGTQSVDLPLVPVADDLTIALLICVDHGVAFAEVAGPGAGALIAPFRPDIVVSVATMGIPLAIEVSRPLGLDDYVILHKTPKIHLGESLAEPVCPSPRAAPRCSGMDPARIDAVRGRRVAVVDDVISTGASSRPRSPWSAGSAAEPVVIGALVTEGSGGGTTLGPDADNVRALGSMPVFRHDPAGSGLVEDWG